MTNTLSADMAERPHPTSIDPAFAGKMISVALENGGDFADVFNEYRRDQSNSMRDGRIDSATDSTRCGVAVRVQVGASTGHAFCESLAEKDLLRTAKLAAQIARQSKKRNCGTPLALEWLEPSNARSYYPLRMPFARSYIPDRDKILKRVVAKAEALDDRVASVYANLIFWERWIEVFASDGTCERDFQPMIGLLAQIALREGDRRETGFGGRSGRSGLEFLVEHSPEAVATEAVHDAQFGFMAKACPAGTMPVVLAPGDAGILIHEAVGHGLEGDFNRKGLSSFSGRLGERVASDQCTVVDEGIRQASSGSINIDDEGVCTGRNVLIENGRLVGYMHDKLNARLMGLESTGNGRRESYKHCVLPRMRTTSLANGKCDAEEIIASVKKGLYAKRFWGGGSVDIAKGDFDFVVKEAYLIENGKLGRPVRGASLVGNGPTAMQAISMVGNDLEFKAPPVLCGKEGQRVPVGFGTPSIKIDQLVVGGGA